MSRCSWMLFPLLEWGRTKLTRSPACMTGVLSFLPTLLLHGLSWHNHGSSLCLLFLHSHPGYLHGSEVSFVLRKKCQRIPLPRKHNPYPRLPGILCYFSTQFSWPPRDQYVVVLFLVSHPALFVSLFLSSCNGWFLSYFSCILKLSWVTGWTLNISPSHISVFLNVFSASLHLKGM